MSVIWKKLAFFGDAPTAHTLGSHSTKAHSELSDAPEGAHHIKFTTTEHSSIGNGAPHHVKYTDAAARAAAVSNLIYGGGWNGVNTIAPSKNAVWDKIEALGGGGGATIATGIYAGNNGNSRQITTGFKCSFVLVASPLWDYLCMSIATDVGIFIRTTLTTDVYDAISTRMLLHATDGFIVDNSGSASINKSGAFYPYWAISE